MNDRHICINFKIINIRSCPFQWYNGCGWVSPDNLGCNPTIARTCPYMTIETLLENKTNIHLNLIKVVKINAVSPSKFWILRIYFCNFRTFLAVLHFNENAGREQKKTRAGHARYGLHYPKWKKGGHTVRKILENPSFGNNNSTIHKSWNFVQFYFVCKKFNINMLCRYNIRHKYLQHSSV